MYALVGLHDANYQPLADLTWTQNKLEYAELHGYKTFCRTDNFIPNVGIGYQKIYFIKELLETHPDIEWFWWTGTDAMITNFGTRIQDRIDTQYHFIVAVDINGINADSFLVRNTPEGRGYMQNLLDLEEECSKHWDVEQRAMSLALGIPPTAQPWTEDTEIDEKYVDVVKLVPQRYMNSFNYKLYGNAYPDHNNDRFGWDGNWQLGDWLIHWPATSLEQRIQLFNFYKEYIIK
jgi:hypothetical protein